MNRLSRCLPAGRRRYPGADARTRECEPTRREPPDSARPPGPHQAELKTRHRRRRAVRPDPCALRDRRHQHAVYSARNPARYAFVPAEGPVVMFEFSGCSHLTEGLPGIDETPGGDSYYFCDDHEQTTEAWADEIDELVRQCGGQRRGVAIESATSHAASRWSNAAGRSAMPRSLERRGDQGPQRDQDGAQLAARSRTGSASWKRRFAPAPRRAGLVQLHQHIIATDADYSNPAEFGRAPTLVRECSNRVIQDGELVALDTDVVGRYGYYADFSPDLPQAATARRRPPSAGYRMA